MGVMAQGKVYHDYYLPQGRGVNSIMITLLSQENRVIVYHVHAEDVERDIKLWD